MCIVLSDYQIDLAKISQPRFISRAGAANMTRVGATFTTVKMKDAMKMTAIKTAKVAVVLVLFSLIASPI